MHTFPSRIESFWVFSSLVVLVVVWVISWLVLLIVVVYCVNMLFCGGLLLCVSCDLCDVGFVCRSHYLMVCSDVVLRVRVVMNL